MPKTTRKCVFDSHYVYKYWQKHWNSSFPSVLPKPRGIMWKCYHLTSASPLWHCMYVMFIVPLNTQAGPIFPIYSFEGQDFCSKNTETSWMRPEDKKLVEPHPPHTPSPSYSHNNRASSLQTLCYFSFSVFTECLVKIHCCMGSWWGHILLNCTLLLVQTVHKHQPCYAFKPLAQNYHTVPPRRPPAFPVHHRSGDLTGPRSLDVCLFVTAASFSPLLCSSFFTAFETVQELVREECGGTAAWHNQSTHTDITELEREGGVWKGVVEGEMCDGTLWLQCSKELRGITHYLWLWSLFNGRGIKLQSKRILLNLRMRVIQFQN